mmetsp:Transcript_20015/g.40485  ORF Transcript_20015/g.40485 Transcript_20015/m.40485 type:complete len:105 (+) Transcript_20015:258-572(+)
MPDNNKVVMAEVNCREPGSRELSKIHQAGAGGWPTLKFFNKETGAQGANYVQKTKQKVCDEMKVPSMVASWIEEVGGLSVDLSAPSPSAPAGDAKKQSPAGAEL